MLETVFWIVVVAALVFAVLRVVLDYGRKIVGAVIYVGVGLAVLFLILVYRASVFEFILGVFR